MDLRGKWLRHTGVSNAGCIREPAALAPRAYSRPKRGRGSSKRGRFGTDGCGTIAGSNAGPLVDRRDKRGQPGVSEPTVTSKRRVERAAVCSICAATPPSLRKQDRRPT